MISMINKQIEFKNIRIVRHLKKPLPPVYANTQSMEQVFLNLLINARDAMPGGGEIVLKTQTCTQDANRYIMVSVSDSGHGIDESNREKLFEPFFTTKKRGKGTGLGLPIVKSILSSIGAEIEVKSCQGKKTEFIIKVPFPKKR